MLLTELLCSSINNIDENSIINELYHKLNKQKTSNTCLIEMYKTYINKIIELKKHPLHNNISQVLSCIYQNMPDKNENDIKLLLSMTDDLFFNIPELKNEYIIKFFKYLNDKRLDNTIYNHIFKYMKNIKEHINNEKVLCSLIVLDLHIKSNNDYFYPFIAKYFNIKDESHLNRLNLYFNTKNNILDALRYLISINYIIEHKLPINLTEDHLCHLLKVCSDLKMNKEHIYFNNEYLLFWQTITQMTEDQLKEIKKNIYNNLNMVSNLFNKEQWLQKMETCKMLDLPLYLDYISYQNLSMETIDFD